MPKVTDWFGRPVSGQMPGLVEGIVVDNQDPESLARVKVKFPTLPDMPEAYWARLLTPHAGHANGIERGWMTIPEVDDEVLVTFLHGDVNHAIVIGGLYNGVDEPPYWNDDGNNNLRVFQSRSGHRVTFDDTPGAERVEFIVYNEEIRCIWDSTAKVLSIYCGKDLIIEAKETITIKCTDWKLECGNSFNLKSGSTTEITSGAALTGEGGAHTALKAGITKIN